MYHCFYFFKWFHRPIFLINDINELVRLNANTGSPVWRVPLPTFQGGERTRSQRSIFTHYGPVLAGGRLIVTSSDGVIRQFDPTSGAALAEIALPGGAASGPVVAGETLYVISKSGALHAFRWRRSGVAGRIVTRKVR